MSIFLHEKFGYRRGDMVILTDDQQNPMSIPTKANILRAMQWLVRDAMPDDSLFIHFSGLSIVTVAGRQAGRQAGRLTRQATGDEPPIWTATKMTATTT